MNTISPTPSASNCGACDHGRTTAHRITPEIRNIKPLTVKLPYRPITLTGRIDIVAVANASPRPHIRPARGKVSVVRSPPVAISTVPMNASATPNVSRLPGSRRPRRHTHASTNSRFRVCNTVAVPELVHLMAFR